MPGRILGMRRGFVIFMLLVLYTIGPVLSVLLASLIANVLGCNLNEGNVHPCKCLGIDIGELLYSMFVMGWLALVTLPTGAMAILAFLAVTIASTIFKPRKKVDSQRN
jgi:hypothetical protein